MSVITLLKRLTSHGKDGTPKSTGAAGPQPGTQLICPMSESQILWCIHACNNGNQIGCNSLKHYQHCIGPATR